MKDFSDHSPRWFHTQTEEHLKLGGLFLHPPRCQDRTGTRRKVKPCTGTRNAAQNHKRVQVKIETFDNNGNGYESSDAYPSISLTFSLPLYIALRNASSYQKKLNSRNRGKEEETNLSMSTAILELKCFSSNLHSPGLGLRKGSCGWSLPLPSPQAIKICTKTKTMQIFDVHF